MLTDALSTRLPATWVQRGLLALVLLLALWGFGSGLGGMPLLDDPNEAEYAEVARGMVQSGDWLTPRLNDAVFLNKPPLTYWLIGLGDRVFGIGEFAARLPSAVAATVIVVLIMRLGTLAFDIESGLLAGAIVFASPGFFIEAHESRPDLLMTVGIVGAMLALQRLRASQGGVGTSLIGWQLALATAVLAKGLPGVVLPALTVLVLLAVERRSDLVRRLLSPSAWWLFVLIMAPWPLWMGYRHPGFLWDYLVNQHLLFFFDRKVPRDSVPVSLVQFWGAFAIRLFPWTLILPLAIVTAARRAGRAQGAGERLVLVWLGVVLLFFSAAASRMEHYSIPALPAAALILAKLFRDYASGRGIGPQRVVTVHVWATFFVLLLGIVAVPRGLELEPWLAGVPAFHSLARTICAILAAGSGAAAVAALVGRRGWVVPALVGSFALTTPLVISGLAVYAQMNSSSALAQVLVAVSDPGEPVVFEAPVEYQTCAGLNFYTRRKLLLLRHRDFVPPPYLQTSVAELFMERADLESLWRQQRLFLVTDPLRPRDVLDGTVPQPRYVVGRDRARWVLTNQPLR